MIAVVPTTGVRPDGPARPLRLLDPATEGHYVYHPRYGFVSERAARSRHVIRQRQGHRDRELTGADWLCSFTFQGGEPVALRGCSTARVADGVWSLSAPVGEFQLVAEEKLAPVVVAPEPRSAESRVSLAMAIMLLVALVAGGYLMTRMQELDKAEDLAALEEQQKIVAIPKVKVAEPKKPAEKKEVVKTEKKKQTTGALVQQKLGFLALLGKKDLTKAMGGMPSPSERKSPGVGAGGTQGSGGEMLTGLGKGLRKTTVGNTGSAGLGGIGKAGAGGGEGGFGSSYVGSGGSGGGRVLSDVNLSEEVELDGGLDKAVIQATIAKYLSQIRACYERGLRQRPGLTGQVTMDFEVNADGRLNFAKVGKTTLEHKDVETCISRVMLSWQFPKPVGGTLVKVNYPFMLKPASYM